MLESLVHDILLFISGNVVLGFNLLNARRLVLPPISNRRHCHFLLVLS